MKRLLILLELLCAMTQATFAKKEGVFMEYHRKSIPEKIIEIHGYEWDAEGVFEVDE